MYACVVVAAHKLSFQKKCYIIFSLQFNIPHKH